MAHDVRTLFRAYLAQSVALVSESIKMEEERIEAAIETMQNAGDFDDSMLEDYQKFSYAMNNAQAAIWSADVFDDLDAMDDKADEDDEKTEDRDADPEDPDDADEDTIELDLR